ncbi:uncharacterized protein LOC141673387 [Apium graveolens]|uniref:uncharacterized protein LOC141673387 n=1 Tax=Apium graveolens TaxID=4045 RepID=UPI003D7B868D
MDRSWLKADRRTKEFKKGVEDLLIFAFENGYNVEKISCPCVNCSHSKSWRAQIVKNHLFQNGIDQTYTRWIWHGENNSAESYNETDTSESINQGTSKMGECDEDDDDDMSSDESSDETDTSDFINHVKGEHQPLYPGCERYTKMKALVQLYNLKVKHGNNIPSSFNEAKKTLCALGMGYEKIHKCPNNCLLYRGNLDEEHTTCRVCKASRWKLNNKGDELEGVDQKWPDFASETRNLRLALSSDGFNPFHGNRTDYSSWPILLSIYNLPPWLCMKRRYIMLYLLISGPTEPENDSDVFLQPLIEDMQELWRGKQMYDAYKKESFMLRGILLWTISDYPALGNLSGTVINGYNACTICIDETKATKLVNYRETVIMRHRRWLPRNHPYRRQKSAFDNTVEKGVTPVPLTGEEVSIFFQLEYWEFLPVRHVLDVMHIEKNICEARLGTLLNIPGKTKDRESVRLDMAEMGIRTELRPKTPGNKEKAICSKVIDVDKLEKMQSELVETLCQLEKHFPPSFFDVMIHLSVHLLREVKLCGLIFLQWVYPFERYLKAFKGYVRNPAHPEGCIAEAYIAGEAMECLNQEIRWIAEGPNKNVPTFSGCRINGVTFSTKKRDDTRQVQCSGVCVVADTMLVQGKEKNIEHTLQTYYGVITSFVNDPFVLGKHVKQVCYIDDPLEKHWHVMLKLPEKNCYEQCDDENDGSVEIELENELQLPMFPNVDEHDEEKASYMRDEDKWIQLP